MNKEDKEKSISFRRYIINEIMREGYITLEKVYGIAETQFGMKQKTAERRLNPSESPFIETIKNDKHHIIGYQWRGYTPAQTEEERLLQMSIL